MGQKKITIYDIAEKTNVSAVTVHRALSNKGRINENTKKLILETAESLGYKANTAAQGLRRNPIKLAAILFCPVDEYVDAIAEGITHAGEDLEKFNVSVDVQKIKYTTTKECLRYACEQIQNFAQDNYNGIILFMSSMFDEMNELTQLINDLAANSDILFATVANDIPDIQQAVHVGVNAHMAGSMAAEILELSCQNKDVALLVTSNTSPVNAEYINGFMNYAKNDVFSNIYVYEHFDEKEKVAKITKQMLEENPNLCGIYMTTASSALACKTITDMGKTGLSIITTDLLSETPYLLKQKIANATIFQNPYKQGKNVVRYLYNYITTKCDGGVHLITPHILVSSNIESYIFDALIDQ